MHWTGPVPDLAGDFGSVLVGDRPGGHRRCLPNQVTHLLEVAVVGNAGGAIGKAEFGANVELDFAAAIRGLATEGLSSPQGSAPKGQSIYVHTGRTSPDAAVAGSGSADRTLQTAAAAHNSAVAAPIATNLPVRRMDAAAAFLLNPRGKISN
jgi:hypothetical protein